MNFLRVLKGNNSLIKKEGSYQIREYCTREYEIAKDMATTDVMVQLLKNVNDALKEQAFLKNDIQVLSEKAIRKIDIRSILVTRKSSYQMLNRQFFDLLGIPGLWQMLQDKFIDFELNVTEDIFKKVASMVIPYLEELSQKEEVFVEEVANGCVTQRADGRIEIVFPGQMWGNDELISRMLKTAEKAGICFVDIPASPISKKAILPNGWKISDFADAQGYSFILDTTDKRRAAFRIKELPNKFDNGEVDFFFDIPVLTQPIQGKLQKGLPMRNRRGAQIGLSDKTFIGTINL